MDLQQFLNNFLKELEKLGKKGSPAVLFVLPALAISCFILLVMFLAQTGNMFGAGPENSQKERSPAFETIYIGSNRTKLSVTIADSESERAEGLMFVQSLPYDQGMLFIFPDEDFRSFWMKNTYIPLDIIFIGSDKRIINIHESAQPLNIDKRYTSFSPAKYVLETNGGWSRAHDLKEGDSVEINF